MSRPTTPLKTCTPLRPKGSTMTLSRASDIYDERGSEVDATALNYQNVGGRAKVRC